MSASSSSDGFSLRQEPKWDKLVLALIVVGLVGVLVGAAEHEPWLIGGGAFWTLMFMAGYLDQRLYRVAIDSSHVRFGGLVLRRAIPRHELASYRVTHVTMYGMSVPYYELFDREGRARGRISGTLRDVAKLQAWLREHLADYDPNARRAAADPRGVRFVNALAGGVLLAAALLLVPTEYVTRVGQAVGLVLVLTFLFAGVVLTIRRRIRFEGLAPLIYLSTSAFGLRALFDGPVASHQPILEIGGFFVLLFWALLQSVVGRESKRSERVAIRSILVATGLSLAYCVNEQLDFRPLTPHATVVTEKRVERGSKTTTYYVTVRSWRSSGPAALAIPVPRAQHDAAVEGQTVTVYTGRGLLGVEWAAGLGL